jgi:hypothetical protein
MHFVSFADPQLSKENFKEKEKLVGHNITKRLVPRCFRCILFKGQVWDLLQKQYNNSTTFVSITQQLCV